MFVQIIKGRTNDPDGLRDHAETWRERVGPGPAGFLGTTAGVAEDGTFVALARFEDEASARANSQRPEQDEWWQGMAKHLGGEVPDGRFVEAASFTGEDAARAGEASTDFAGTQQEYASMFTELTFLDLRDPMLVTP